MFARVRKVQFWQKVQKVQLWQKVQFWQLWQKVQFLQKWGAPKLHPGASARPRLPRRNCDAVPA
jgi:hypothetical protein